MYLCLLLLSIAQFMCHLVPACDVIEGVVKKKEIDGVTQI